MISERNIVGKIEVLENGVIQTRFDTVIERDNREVIRTFSRQVYVPGQDTTGLPQRVIDIANVVWTPEVIAAYRASVGINLPVNFRK